jgi:NADH:ubiquinone oxidoreductase subunit 5 (subunit L)/multisubunit Na+/H+ antiporter MnhA subunit
MLNGFVGEFLIVVGSYASHAAYAALAAAGVVLAAVYLRWMYQRVFYGEITNEKSRVLPDCDAREKLILVVMAMVIIAMGVYPQPFLHRLERSVNAIMLRIENRSMLVKNRAGTVDAVSAVGVSGELGIGTAESGSGNPEAGISVLRSRPHSQLPVTTPPGADGQRTTASLEGGQ